MLINLINLILFVLVSIAFITLNTIITKEAIQRGLTFSEIIAENQNTKIGKIFMILSCIPTFLILYIKSLLPIDTKSCFDKIEDTELTSEQIREKYPSFFDVGEHCVMYVRNGIVEETIDESCEYFEDVIQWIEDLHLKKIRRFSHTLHIREEVE